MYYISQSDNLKGLFGESHIDLVEVRHLIITLERERWAQSTTPLASALQETADRVTFNQRESARKRLDDKEIS